MECWKVVKQCRGIYYVDIVIYLFIYGVLNDTVSKLDHLMSNYMMINE